MGEPIDEALVLRYALGEANELEQIEVEQAAAENEACFTQVQNAMRTVKALRKRFDWSWDHLTLAEISKTTRAVTRARYAAAVSVAKAERCTTLRVWLGPDGKMRVAGMESYAIMGVEYARTADPKEKVAMAAGEEDVAQWRIPVSQLGLHLELFVQVEPSESKWYIRLDLTIDKEGVEIPDDLRVSVSPGEDEARLFVPWADVVHSPVPVSPGEWVIEFSRDNESVCRIPIIIGSGPDDNRAPADRGRG